MGQEGRGQCGVHIWISHSQSSLQKREYVPEEEEWPFQQTVRGMHLSSQAKKGRERSSPGPHGATWNCTNVNLHAPSYCSANSKWIIDSRAKTKAMGPAKVPEKSYGFGINKDFLATPEA